jgi:hypothetical protein
MRRVLTPITIPQWPVMQAAVRRRVRMRRRGRNGPFPLSCGFVKGEWDERLQRL